MISGTYTLNETGEVSNMIAGPYRCQKDNMTVDRVYVDLEMPEGLYHVDKDDDRLTTNSVSFKISLQEIDPETGAHIGVPVERTPVYSSKKRDPIRDTVTIYPVSQGAFEVTVERTEPISDNSRDIDKTLWTGLRSRVVPWSSGSYSDTTLMAVRMKATNGMGIAARSRLRVVMSRDKLFGGTLNSFNPIVALKDIWNNSTYGLGRPLDELSPDLELVQWVWEQNGPKLNGSFDVKGTGMEAMQQAVSLAAARVIQDGGLITVVPDQVQTIRRALYSDANIVAGSLNIDYNFDTNGDTDHIEIEYRDPVTWNADYVTYPLAGGDTPDSYKLFGCTNKTYAEQFARYLDNVKHRRRKIANFKVELEGLIPKFGNMIGIASSVPYWGESGVVVDVTDLRNIRVDKELNWTANNVMILRDDYGAQLGQFSVTQGPGGANTVTFEEDVVVYGPEGRDPTNYIFGENDTLIRDFQITKVSPDTETTVAIEAQVYYDFIFEGGPPHMNPPGEVPSCSAYANTITTLSPDHYYPMNIQSDLDNYPTTQIIRDYASGAHLASPVVGKYPRVQPSNFSNCSGNCTGILDDSSNTYWFNDTGTSPDALTLFFCMNNYGGGDSIYYNIEWHDSDGYDSQFKFTKYSPTNSIRIELRMSDGSFGGNSEVWDVPLSALTPTSDQGCIGFRVFQETETSNMRVEVYWNFTLIYTFDASGDEPTTYWEGGNPLQRNGFMGEIAGGEEMCIWRRKLTDEEILELKAGWDPFLAYTP